MPATEPASPAVSSNTRRPWRAPASCGAGASEADTYRSALTTIEATSPGVTERDTVTCPSAPSCATVGNTNQLRRPGEPMVRRRRWRPSLHRRVWAGTRAPGALALTNHRSDAPLTCQPSNPRRNGRSPPRGFAGAAPWHPTGSRRPVLAVAGRSLKGSRVVVHDSRKVSLTGARRRRTCQATTGRPKCPESIGEG